MNGFKQVISRLPWGIFSLITILAILWLTLAPKPLGEEPPQLFEGADKVVHAFMFGGLAIMMLFDWQRKHSWRQLKWVQVLLSATFSTCLGIIIECCQEYMNLGRGFDYWDIVADAFGAYFFAFLWEYFQKFWVNYPDK